MPNSLDRGVLLRFFEREELARIETEQILEKVTLELYNTNEELQTIFNTTKDGIAILDLDTHFLFSNKAYLELTGFCERELLTKKYTDFFEIASLPPIEEILNEILKNGSIENMERVLLVKKGRIVVNMSISLLPKNKLLLALRDITEIKRKEKLLNDYINLIDKHIVISSTDLEGNITSVSDAFCAISGHSKSELIGQNHRIVRHPDMPTHLYETMWKTIAKGKVWEGELKNLTKDGESYWVHMSVSPIHDENDKHIGYTAIRQDITDKKRIEEISITDGLTKIYNRRHFDTLFPRVLKIAQRYDYLIAFVILDIDYFKQYNDTYGHKKGDDVLIALAQSIKSSLHRGDDYCFRLGGEEFAIIFHADSTQKAREFADVIRQNIEALKIEHSGNKVSPYVTASLGLVCKKARDIKDQDEIYQQSDKLLYEAKAMGRNRVVALEA